MSDYFGQITEQRQEFIKALPKIGRILGIDLGRKRTGLAISDQARRLAQPYGHLMGNQFSTRAKNLIIYMQQEGVVGLVIGLPLNQFGKDSAKSQSARQFARNLIKFGINCPILMLDERLSSKAIDRMLVEQADLTRQKRLQIRDPLTASWLLQNLLDSMNPLIA